MKKILSFILTALILCAMLAGCTVIPDPELPEPTQGTVNTVPPSGQQESKQTPGPVSSDEPSGEIAGISAALYADAFRVGGGTEQKLTYRIYTDYESLIKEIPAAAEYSDHYSEKAFEEIFVVAVIRTFNTGGHSFGFEKGSVKDGVAEIYITEQGPGANEMVTMAFDTQCVLIAFPAKDYRSGMSCSVMINGAPLDRKVSDH